MRGLPRPCVRGQAARARGFSTPGAGIQRRTMSARSFTLLGVLVSLALAGDASGSIKLATNPERPALRVDGRGNAEVSWTAAGVRRYVFVPPTAASIRVAAWRPPMSAEAAVLSRSRFGGFSAVPPDGRLWALQAWRVQAGGPVELRFSRWRGEPPKMTLTSQPRFDGELSPAALLPPAAPFRSTPDAGRQAHPQLCPHRSKDAHGLEPDRGAATRADGTFRLFIPAAKPGASYRTLLPGPNLGTTLAPDTASPPVPSPRQ